MKKIKLNKKNKLIILSLCIIIIIIIIVIFNNNKTLTCTKINDSNEFIIKDKIILKNNNNKISNIEEEKEVDITGDYQSIDEYENIINNLFTNAYQYLDSSKYTINKEDNKVFIKVNTNEQGIIIDNINIDKEESGFSFGSKNTLENNNTINIGDNIKDIKKKLKDANYKCN